MTTGFVHIYQILLSSLECRSRSFRKLVELSQRDNGLEVNRQDCCASVSLDFSAFEAEGSESVGLLVLSVSLSDFSFCFPACSQIIKG